MDPKKARELIDQVCAELDAARDNPGQATGFLRRVVRPAGLGLLMGLGSAGALAGCGESGDLYGIPPAGDAYGIFDSAMMDSDPGLDLPPAGDLYGVPDTMEDGVEPPPEVGPGDLYGVIDTPVMDMPQAGDLYGVPDAGTNNG